MPVYRLPEDKIIFPDPRLAEEDGLLAFGGDLSTERLLLAYSNGIFPWYNEGEPVMWWCPQERFIIRPENIHISHSLAKYMRKHEVRMSVNRDFADTMHRCRMKRENAEGTWITDDMEKAYGELNRRGYAMAVEAVVDGEIAGGLYGVVIGKNFFGESMYSDRENGSKLALVLLAEDLKEKGFHMIDCQFHTDFLESMGGGYISYEEYMEMIDR
ncbi:MAG: leucyl/phenylalanyl-tRNA--protein transferase [Lachnospiraceae bacterium]|nr:leucyl/phenylalanyl-tRNA--protein transferase [Lachnospiraceae bacterium]